MFGSMSLTDKESLHNYLDYRDDIGFELSLQRKHKNPKDHDLAVIKELHVKNLVNNQFYRKQCETINMLYQYTRQEPGCLAHIKSMILVGGFTISIIGVGGILLYTCPRFMNPMSDPMDKFDI